VFHLVPADLFRRNPILTTGQADHFRTFGFTVLRGYLADRVTALRAEADAAIRDAYAATYDERVFEGISGHYLPMASRLTSVSMHRRGRSRPGPWPDSSRSPAVGLPAR
jgi:hypothetical protein